jgi:hypothetical protein
MPGSDVRHLVVKEHAMFRISVYYFLHIYVFRAVVRRLMGHSRIILFNSLTQLLRNCMWVFIETNE